MTWLVAGLGNPGKNYSSTRHNVGWMVADALAGSANERFRKVRFVPLEVAEIRDGDVTLLVAKPLTFMNDSGPPIGSLARRRKIDPSHIVVIHDEIDLPLGALRVKLGGSTAGHQGLNSVVSGLRTPDFYRVRLGVGRPPGRQDPADYVLEPFSKKELDEVPSLVEAGAETVRSLVAGGLEAAQNSHTRSGTKSKD
ncbi:MAG: aminoacyl-tRNA hydrolase [Actinomycetota bacterium]